MRVLCFVCLCPACLFPASWFFPSAGWSWRGTPAATHSSLNLHKASGPHSTPLPDNTILSVELTVFISASLSWLVCVIVTNLFFSSCVFFSSLCFAALCLSSCFRLVRVCFRSGVSWPAFCRTPFRYFYERNFRSNKHFVHFYASPVSALGSKSLKP